ncbi:MAG: hypothetical protein NZ585_05345, partial [Chloracidobacterium sp.]|nr:hypothetical protein [Chloracidobacterium sp.]
MALPPLARDVFSSCAETPRLSAIASILDAAVHFEPLSLRAALQLLTTTDPAARHDILRTLQRETGGFTEFIPLPFIAAKSP